MKRDKYFIYLFLIFLVFSTGLLSAQSERVTSPDNDGPGTLRELVENTMATEIIIPDGMVIDLEDEIIVSRPLTITGEEGNTGVTIQVDRNHDVKKRIFMVDIPTGDLSIKNMTLIGGIVDNDFGGAIFVPYYNDLYLEKVTIKNSSARRGGAIYTAGSVYAKECKFTDNYYTASAIKTGFKAFGAVICADGDVVLQQSAVENNYIDLSFQTSSPQTIEASGSAIFCEGIVTLEDSRLVGNLLKTDAGTSYLYFEVKGGIVHALNGLVINGNCEISDNKVNHKTARIESHVSGGVFYTEEDVLINGSSVFRDNELYMDSYTAREDLKGGVFYLSGLLTITGTDHLFSGNKITYTLGGTELKDYTSFGGSIYVVEGVKDCYIENTSFINCKATLGGGIYLGNSAKLALKNVGFTGCHSYQSGGGLYGSKGTTVIANDCFFHKNIAGNQGGALNVSGRVELYNCEFGKKGDEDYGNQAKYAGAVSVSNRDVDGFIAEGCNFYFNKSQLTGGALRIGSYLIPSTFFKITNCNFENNLAYTDNNPASRGGAIEIQTDDCETDIQILNSTFKNNKSKYAGGAVFIWGNNDSNRSPISITIDSQFEGNISESGSGGGCYILTEQADVTIKEGVKFTGNTSGDFGGGLYYYGRGTFILEDNILFENNISTEYGGGFACTPKSDQDAVVFGESILFKENQSGNGGGGLYLSGIGNISIGKQSSFIGNESVWGGGLFSFNSDVVLEESEFKNNTTSSHGAAIYVYEKTFTLKNSVINNNIALGDGIFNNYQGTVEIDGCEFSENEAVNVGTLFNMGSSSLTISNSKIKGNKVNEWGAGISNKGDLVGYNLEITDNIAGKGAGGIDNQGTLQLANTLIADNSGAEGGGIYTWSPSAQPMILTNVTIAGNKSSNRGAGIYNSKQTSVSVSVPLIRNTIIWGNGNSAADNIYGVTNCDPKYEYSLVGGYTTADSNGNIDGMLDPLFTSTYLLQPGSPAMDKGNNSLFEAGNNPDLSHIITDLAGNDRIFKKSAGGIIDMGAYEYASASAEFTGDGNPVCEGSNGTLNIRLQGVGPWTISYQRENSTTVNTVKVNPSDRDANGVYALSGLNPGKYILTGLTEGTEGNEITGELGVITEASISSVSSPSVQAIEGPSGVKVGENIQLTNTTTGGYWYSEDTQYATVDQTGKVTGVRQGVVEIWYVVTGGAPTNCETIVTRTITVTTDGGGEEPGPDPDPDPDPDPNPDPEPDPSPIINVHDGNYYCYTDRAFRISFDMVQRARGFSYIIVYSDEAKAAGFEDILEYRPLNEEDEYITVPVSGRIPKGKYKGEIRLKYYKEINFPIREVYPFEVEVMDITEIITHPRSFGNSCEGDGFILNVEAIGDELAYQWYFNDRPIKGATSATYEGTVSAETLGKYYVEVIGFCNADTSEVATISGSALSIHMKWDDVLFVYNTNNLYSKFQWYRNGQPITVNGTSVYYTDPDGLSGEYRVRAYKADGTFDESCIYSVNSSVTTRSIVSVYPTIVDRSSFVNIECGEPGDNYYGSRVEVFTFTGRKVYSGEIRTPKMEIPMNQPAGAYLLHIIAPDGRRKIEKIIVK